jgi:hypothetical protein
MLFRERALRIAITQIGVTERPPGSNWGPQVSQYLTSAGYPTPAPWCMAFVHWCYLQAGLEIGGGASVGLFENWGRSHGEFVEKPMHGDVVCYRFDADNWPDHVGIVTEGVFGKTFKRFGMVRTIEGNTAVGNDGNGGKVMRRTRRISRCRFVRVPGGPHPADPEGTVYHLVWRNGIPYTEPIPKAKRKRAA